MRSANWWLHSDESQDDGRIKRNTLERKAEDDELDTQSDSQ